MLDHGGSPDDQHAAQSLVAGSRDPPSLTLPAVEWSFGVKPIQAANWRPDRNSSGCGVFIVSSTAPIGPTPGILVSRRLHSSARCQAMSLASTLSICACSCAYSKVDARLMAWHRADE